MSIQEDLIELFSRGPIDSVYDSDDYQKLCHANVEDPTFNELRNKIEEIRHKLDDHMNKSKSYREQVQNALRLLRRLEKDEKKISRTLVLNMLNTKALKWSIEARKYYEEKSEFMIDAVDYFLSFTNRNPGSPDQNDINRNHQHFICQSLGCEYNPKINCNLVAKTVHYHLSNRLFSGFYYPQHEGNNDDVKEKLSKNCIGSLAFVQLIQAAMFKNICGSPNWCFFEYNLAYGEDPKRILFVQIEEDIREDGIDAAFDGWYQNFVNKDSIKLRSTWKHSDDLEEVIYENRHLIRDKLSQQIEEAVNRIYLAIPE